ncbi:hypothetical protein BDD12DRAFT_898959 [Trichophaea hybrida]|nr:hypothetical protein BDD12DRAFT_898959 [Trichophaea hybrida]
MQQEARNTERHHIGWGGEPLRNMGISFVAAGTLSSEELLKPTIADPKDKDSSAEENAEFTADVTESSPSSMDKSPESNGEETTAQIDVGKLNLGPVEEKAPRQEVSGFVLDLIGDATVDLKIKNPTVRAPSPSPSVSSTASEKIVFVPKSRRGGISQSKSTTQQLSPQPKPTKTPSVSTRIEPTPKVVVKTTESTTITTTSISLSQTEGKPSRPTEPEDFIKLNGQSQWNGKRATPGNKRRKPKGEKQGRGRKTADQEAIKDYMENIAAQMRAEAAEDAGGETSMDGAGLLRDIGGDDLGDDSSTDEDDAASDSDAVRMYKSGGWDSDRIRDFEDFSTDDEKPRGSIATLLGKRIRPSGLQYLIKWDGYETDDATWTLAKTLDSSSEAKVKKYEEKLAKIAAQMGESSSSGSSESSGGEEDDDDDDDDDDDEDEDRKLAKLLQREEELMMMGVENDFDEVMDLQDDFFPMGIGKKSKKKRKSRQNIPDIIADSYTGRFPSATETAAAYDGFDVMDWERPSIATGRKRKGKGRIAQLNLSDSELEAQITNTWERDRQSKKLRKIRREELRAQGMLGAKANKTGKANMSDKYKEGMTMTQISDEIRTFMLKQDTTRFTTIIKTSGSGIYEHDEEGVDSVLRGGRFAKRMDVDKGGRGRNGGEGGGKGGRNKDGMVVGAEAPELSATNKGRLMLEKMGYKTGMSLGVEGNEGISEPLIAIIKMSKAGLG